MTQSVTMMIDRRSARRILILLIAAVVGLSLLSFVANIMYVLELPGSRLARAVFGVDQETSIATWWSTVVLFFLSLLTLIVGAGGSRVRRERMIWWALAAGFLFLSIDESAMLHERIGGLLDIDGDFHHARWILLWLPLSLSVAGTILWRFWQVSRQAVVGIVIGSVVFLSGAVGMELVNVKIRSQAQEQALVGLAQLEKHEWPDDASLLYRDEIDRRGQRNYAYIVGTAVEELLEMLGVIIWVAVIFRAGFEQRSRAPVDAKMAEHPVG